jgi:hypothetical protein
MPWFRLYCETVRDAKLRRLQPAHRWLWIAVLTMARQSHEPGVLLVAPGEPATLTDVADAAALTLTQARRGLAEFERLGMVGQRGIAWTVVNWEKRQSESDTSAARTRRYREKKRDRDGDVTSPTGHDGRHGDGDPRGRSRESQKLESESEPLSPLQLLTDVGATDEEAREILAALEANPRIEHPEGWVRKVAASNGDLAAHVDRHRAAKPRPVPPWCGECESAGHRYREADGREAPCPDCHPGEVTA